MTDFLLIRHAHNDWVNNRLAGWTPGVHLSAQGQEEAQALAKRLATHRLDAVYSSPLERAQETAACLVRERDLAVQVLDEVGEVRYGDWTGRELKALRKDPLWATVQQFPSLVRFPGGESLVEVQARVVAAVDSLRARHPDQVVAVVSHGDVIKAAVAHFSGAHLDMFQRFSVATASLSVLRFTANGPHLALFNDTGAVPPFEPPQPAEDALAMDDPDSTGDA